MQFSIMTLLLGAVSLVSGAAFYPIRQANFTTAPVTDCGSPETVTATVTVGYPTIITVANPDQSSIASSLSYVASVDSLQILESSELRPVSAPPDTNTPEFTHSIVAPAYTASEVSQGNNSVYFISVGPNTTDWSYTPTASVIIGYTTVIVTPLEASTGPSSISHSTTSIHPASNSSTVVSNTAPVLTVSSTASNQPVFNTTTIVLRTTVLTVTASHHSAFTPLSSGWNTTHWTESMIAGGTGTSVFIGTIVSSGTAAPVSTGILTGTGAPIGTGILSGTEALSSTIVRNGTGALTGTIALNSTVAPTGTGASNGTGAATGTASRNTLSSSQWATTVTQLVTIATTTVNFTAWPTFPNITTATPLTATGIEFPITTSAPEGKEKRQTCMMVYATISGHLASWCNNWDGSTVSYESTYATTVYPSNAPVSTTYSAVPEPTTTTVTTVPGSTVTDTLIPVSSTSSAPSATSSCGQTGNFVIDFDDLGSWSPPDNNTADFPPIFNPYEHFFWGNGWAYVPPPNEPFPAQSPPHLAEYVPSLANNDTGSPDAGLIPDSSFGCGPRNYDNNYWFNVESAYVGCDNGDPTITCDFVATGYQWDADQQTEVVVVTQHYPQPACAGFQNCHLRQIYFGDQFTALSSLNFYANVAGQIKIFWVDTIELSWWNNTCAAGLSRIGSRKLA